MSKLLTTDKVSLKKVTTLLPNGFEPWLAEIKRFCVFHKFLPHDVDFTDLPPWIECFNKGCFTTEAIDIYIGDLPLRKTKIRKVSFSTWLGELDRFVTKHAIGRQDIMDNIWLSEMFERHLPTTYAVDVMLGYITLEEI